MTVVSHPVPGTIDRVDLSQGFRPPEMVKRRPAVVLSPPIKGRQQLCTVVPLSTTPPRPVLPHHIEIAFDPPLPYPYGSPTAWLKGDIVLTVALHRLRLLSEGKQGGQRVYDVRVLDPDVFERVKECVKAGVGL
ncbi:type II toxin-antitoxin system PemK/MazF family toxin [Antarcticimicrobium sediminis]|uniref:Type II toxin-antitoxin system PemK/MazF family toxin n=1 Tax=Antarcticimicrobium sediminis TaxID=2546227 RepID=A0A4R5EG74_9RHOB|nr:type II toxin-antitoxin system PemK/MazF family toxin [Antarcticimicrobium sediminis]